jgi:hypothetical protein
MRVGVSQIAAQQEGLGCTWGGDGSDECMAGSAAQWAINMRLVIPPAESAYKEVNDSGDSWPFADLVLQILPRVLCAVCLKQQQSSKQQVWGQTCSRCRKPHQSCGST